MKLGHRRMLSLAKGENQRLMEPDENVRERRMRSDLIPLFMRKFIFARALKRKEMHFESERTRLKGGKIKHANGEEEGTRS